MICKKCGFIQDDNKDECIKCGVVFKKLYLNELINNINKINPKHIKSIKAIHNNFKNNSENNYKLIYRCFNNDFLKLALTNLKNDTEKKLFINLINNKLKTKKSSFFIKPSILFSTLIFLIILILYIFLK